MPRRRKGRALSGILLLDKPKGLTSNKVLQLAKNIFNAQKAGHTGSLDPIATGLLPVCFGEATKVSAYLLEADKAYMAICRLGQTTNSGDAEGEILQHRTCDRVTAAKIQQILGQFVGEIVQTPPMHSAIKQNGVPLYKLAHQGIEVEREPRKITIHKLEFKHFEDNMLEFEVHCSKGTYIRTLAEDIGEALGCGAHIVELRRTKVGPFENQAFYTLDQLKSLKEKGFDALDPLLLPTETALMAYPEVSLSKDAEFYLQQGQAVFVPKTTVRGLVRLYACEGEFLGLGSVLDDGRVAPKRLMNQAKMG